MQAKGTAPKDPSLMARLSSEVMSTMQTLADSSDSKIAEMTIKGNNMGITKGLKHLHDYEGKRPAGPVLGRKNCCPPSRPT